jgi:hypothetical protein
VTIRRSNPALALAAVLGAGLATPAFADDPPLAEGRPEQTTPGLNPALPRPGAVLDAMPIVRLPPGARAERAADPGPIEVDATGATGGELTDPGLGERPTPREALQESDLGETIMRPRAGSASGGKPDVPPER